MTTQPTPEQIEAEREKARFLAGSIRAIPYQEDITNIATVIATARLQGEAKGREKALDEALEAQPSTAENPNEDAYQRGRFDGVMEYARAILALKEKSK